MQEYCYAEWRHGAIIAPEIFAPVPSALALSFAVTFRARQLVKTVTGMPSSSYYLVRMSRWLGALVLLFVYSRLLSRCSLHIRTYSLVRSP